MASSEVTLHLGELSSTVRLLNRTVEEYSASTNTLRESVATLVANYHNLKEEVDELKKELESDRDRNRVDRGTKFSGLVLVGCTLISSVAGIACALIFR